MPLQFRLGLVGSLGVGRGWERRVSGRLEEGILLGLGETFRLSGIRGLPSSEGKKEARRTKGTKKEKRRKKEKHKKLKRWMYLKETRYQPLN